MPVRRSADPSSVQHVWDAIRVSNHQRQMADAQRIVKYLQKVLECSETQAELYLQQTVDDGLIFFQQKTIAKGQAVGALVDSYRIPLDNLKIPPDDGKDWYCIECHLAGDVVLCKTCFRVFHSECTKNARCRLDVFKIKQTKTPDSKKKEIIEVVQSDAQYVQSPTDNKVEVVEDVAKEDETKQMAVEEIEKKMVEIEEEKEKVEKKLEKVEAEDFLYDEEMCSLCNLERVGIDCGISKEELNHLLTFVLNRIRTWLPENLTGTMAPDTIPEWSSPQERNWRALQLFYKHVDMPVMDLKLRCHEYSSLSDFYADAVTVQHNIAIYHGTESQEYAASELMLQDCIHDMNELLNCADCYKHSNEKVHDKWFCIPCRVPHGLVWAKQKGYPHWPAKIIREMGNSYDVRYFGGKNERSVLPKNCVKPITTSMSSLQIKKGAAFKRAYDDLQLHQKLIADPSEIDKLLAIKKKKKARQTSLSSSKSETSLLNGSQDLTLENVANGVNKNKRKSSLESTGSNTSTPLKKLRIPRNKPQFPSDKSSRTDVKPKNGQSDVINISDGEESEYIFPNDEYQFNGSIDNSRDQVSSSTEFFASDSLNANADGVMHQLDQPYCDAVEKMRRKLEVTAEKSGLIKTAMDCMQAEIDKITNEHNEHLKKLFESHNAQISETKKKQWCYNCEQDAIYHCCWNTAYCSPTCQQQHWQAEHKKVCRRKR